MDQHLFNVRYPMMWTVMLRYLFEYVQDTGDIDGAMTIADARSWTVDSPFAQWMLDR